MECRLCLQSWWHHIVWSTDKLTLYMSLWNQSGSINIPALCLFGFFFSNYLDCINKFWSIIFDSSLQAVAFDANRAPISLENSKTAWITDTCLWSAVCGHDCNLPKIFFYTISPIIFIHYFYTLKSIVRHLCFDNKRYSFDGINLLSDCIKLQQRAPQIPT